MLGPSRLGPAFIGEQIHGMAEVFVAAPPDVDFVNLPGLVTHRSGTRRALQSLCIRVEAAVATDLAQ